MMMLMRDSMNEIRDDAEAKADLVAGVVNSTCDSEYKASVTSTQT